MGSYVELGGVSAWRAEPKGPARGGLILIHEIWGLVGHARDIADRFADEGYVVYAPDLLTAAGTTPDIGEELQAIMGDTSPDGDERRNAAQPQLRAAFGPSRAPDFAEPTVARLRTVLEALSGEPGVDGRIGVVGFCFGGSYAFAIAAADSRIRASVAFYGSPPEADAIATIACPVLAFYGDEDAALMESLPTLENEMAHAGVDFQAQVYPNAGHAFFNDQNPRQYQKSAAHDSWNRTVAFLDESLR